MYLSSEIPLDERNWALDFFINSLTLIIMIFVLVWKVLWSESIILTIFFKFLEILKCLKQSVISNAQWWESVTWIVGKCFLYVVILKIKKLLIVESSFRYLSMKECCIWLNQLIFFGILYKLIHTWLSLAPILSAKLKLPKVTTELNLFSKTCWKKCCLSSYFRNI